MEDKAIDMGHSTPKMAAQYAERVGARVLMLYHFSQRYKTVPVNDTVSIMGNNRNISVTLRSLPKTC